MSDTVSNLWAGLDPEIDRRLREKIKPNPATGELDDGDILMYLRELEDDPDLQAMLEHGNAERKRREESIDFDTFDFGSLPSTPSTWRVTLEPGGLVDPETKSIVRPHEVDAFPDARQTFRVTGWVPSQKMRYVEDFEELPKSGELTLFLKKLFVIPFGNYQSQTPANLIMSHKFALHEHAIAPFLDSIPSMSWRIESQDQGAFVNDMVYQIASRDYKRHLAAGLKAKERGNEFFKNNDRRRAIDAYTESLRRYEDAIAQKVMEHEKAAVFKHIAVVCANRSFAYVKEGMGPGRDVETGIIDAENAIYADKTYSKAYARLARAYQAKGNLKKAQEAIVRGLNVPLIENEAVLVEILIELQTEGKGLPEDKEEYRAWAEKVLADENMRGVKGEWRRRIEERLNSDA